MINYFYNITSKDDEINFYTDVLTNIRKDFYHTKEKTKGKISQNSSLKCVHYEFSLDKNKALKWHVSDDSHILSDCKSIEEGKYCVSYYGDSGITKKITFSKMHTLLKVEYFDPEKSTSPVCVIEPRKSNNGLCLLMNYVGSYQSVILFAMPTVDDDYISDMVDNEFTDYSAVASTNEGLVKFLDTKQLEEFEKFIDRAQAMKLTDNLPQSFIDESDAVLAKKLNPKDFNVKRNLSEILDITDAQEFSFGTDDEFDELLDEMDVEDTAPVFEEITNTHIDKNESFEPVTVIEDTTDNKEQLFEDISTDVDETPFRSTFVEYTQADIDNNTVGVIEDTTTPDEDIVEPVQIPEVIQPVEIIEEIVSSKPQDEVLDTICESAVETVAQPDIDVVTDEIETTPEFVENTQNVIEESEEVACETEEAIADVKPQITEITDNDESFVIGDELVADRVINSSSAVYHYYGELDDKNNRHGFGRTATDNGTTAYEGYYENNKRNGVGAYYYKDGKLCYYGNWNDNKRDGFGIGISSIDNSVHVGLFKDNKPHGDGVRVAENGEIKFIQKTLSDGMFVTLKFDGDKIIVIKHNSDGEVISENSSNLKYF